jgi:hypothetical protein
MPISTAPTILFVGVKNLGVIRLLALLVLGCIGLTSLSRCAKASQSPQETNPPALESPSLPHGNRCAATKLFVAGSPEEVAREAREFLIDSESVQRHPYIPAGSAPSGITLGVGWDVGRHTRVQMHAAWAALGDATLSRLDAAVGKRGAEAKIILPKLRDIEIAPSLAIQVLDISLRDQYLPFVVGLFPGLERLPAAVQVVLISIVFNRGSRMGGDPDWANVKEPDRRWEMREMQGDVANGDLFGIYAHLGTMKRVWETTGPRGLVLRRRDEQALIRPLVDQQLQCEQTPAPPSGLTVTTN